MKRNKLTFDEIEEYKVVMQLFSVFRLLDNIINHVDYKTKQK